MAAYSLSAVSSGAPRAAGQRQAIASAKVKRADASGVKPGRLESTVPLYHDPVPCSTCAPAPIDFVERFAYPLPVTVISRILGVPLEDEPKFHAWTRAIVDNTAPLTESLRRQREQASSELRQDMAELVKRRRK